MDRESIVNSIDQAIFTSIRSPMGAGYRIVACSTGVTPEEKAEITQRSPSHDSLCLQIAPTGALTSYRLTSGRHCIAHSQHAGMEHTGRGGPRVYTHITLLDEAAFDEFVFNPMCVWQAVRSAAGDTPNLRPPPYLPPLNLPCYAPRSSEAEPGRPGESARTPPLAKGGQGGITTADEPVTASDLDLICRIGSVLIGRRRLIVIGGRPALTLVEWALMFLPRSLRRTLTFSAGIKPAPSRPLQLAWLARESADLRSITLGPDVHVLDADVLETSCAQHHALTTPANPQSTRQGEALGRSTAIRNPQCDEWFTLMRSWSRQQRWDEISSLTADLSMQVQPSDLDRIAAICRDMDLITIVKSPELEQMTARYRSHAAANAVETRLLARLLQAITVEQRKRASREKIESSPSPEYPAPTAAPGHPI